MIHDADRHAVLQMSSQLLTGLTPLPLEHRIIHKNGSVRWIKNTPMPRHDQQARLVAYDGLVTDITDRKQAEQELLRTNRALQALSQCNQVLVRAGDESQLLNDVCRIIVDAGGYRMCWVGYVDNNDASRIHPAAWAGHEDGYISKISATWPDGPRDREPCSMSIRTVLPVIIKNASAESPTAFGKQAFGALCCSRLLPASPATAPSACTITPSEPGVFDERGGHLQNLRRSRLRDHGAPRSGGAPERGSCSSQAAAVAAEFSSSSRPSRSQQLRLHY
jgi:hypothetical protein